MTEDLNRLAVIVGAVTAFGLGMIWFSPVMFGKPWMEGSHAISPPASPRMLPSRTGRTS